MADPNLPPPPRGSLPEDGIYRAILMVLVASVVVGAVIALVGELVWHSEPISHAGAWMALICGGIYFVFRWLGRREIRKRTARNREDGND